MKRRGLMAFVVMTAMLGLSRPRRRGGERGAGHERRLSLRPVRSADTTPAGATALVGLVLPVEERLRDDRDVLERARLREIEGRLHAAAQRNLWAPPDQPRETQSPGLPDLCTGYRLYTYEWTPAYYAWLVDGVELRRDTGAAAQAFADNAPRRDAAALQHLARRRKLRRRPSRRRRCRPTSS